MLSIPSDPKKSFEKAMLNKNINIVYHPKKEHCKRYETYVINLLQCDIFFVRLFQTSLLFILVPCYRWQNKILSYLF